jgi:hypothetical protein
MKQFNLHKQEGVLKGNRPLYEALQSLNDGRWIVTIAKAKKQRSLNQNAFYHGIVLNEVKDGLINMGFERHMLDHETIHEMLKAKFLKKDVANEEGQFITIIQSTASLSTVEFNDFIAEIQQWAAEFLGVVINDPGQQKEIF